MTLKELCTGIQHIGIPTGNMGATLVFYKELGFEIVHSNTIPDTTNQVFFLQLHNIVIEAYEDDNPAMVYGAIEHIALDVSDIEETYQMICDKNLNTLNDTIHNLPFWDKGIKYFIIEGPNKEKVEFNQIV